MKNEKQTFVGNQGVLTLNSMSLDNVHNMRHFEHDILDVTHASTTVYPNAQQSEMHKGKKKPSTCNQT